MNDIDLPPHTTLPPETRDRLRSAVTAGVAEPHRRPGRLRVPMAAAAGVVALAAGAAVVTSLGGDEPSGNTPLAPAAQSTAAPTASAAAPEAFTTECLDMINREDPATWTTGASVTVGENALLMLRTPDRFGFCVTGKVSSSGDFAVGTGDATEPSDMAVGYTSLLPDAADPDLEPIIGGALPEQAAGLTLTLDTGDTVDATVVDGTFAAHLPIAKGADPNVMVWDRITSVRVVDEDGTVLHEGPLALV